MRQAASHVASPSKSPSAATVAALLAVAAAHEALLPFPLSAGVARADASTAVPGTSSSTGGKPSCDGTSVCPGDVVLEVGGVRVWDPASALAALSVSRGPTGVLVLRAGKPQFVRWEPALTGLR